MTHPPPHQNNQPMNDQQRTTVIRLVQQIRDETDPLERRYLRKCLIAAVVRPYVIHSPIDAQPRRRRRKERPR